MRKLYIDNLRLLCVLLLFPFHTCMIYNTFGESFYVKGPGVRLLNDFILFTSPWFMPLLFVIAGISSAYALKKRTKAEYLRERFFKLFLPFLSGLLLYIPVQTYFAERYHNSYKGGYLEQYCLFFTKPTDLTGYKGGFTPGNLWFILYLFLISLLLLPILKILGSLKEKNAGQSLNHSSAKSNFKLPVVLALFFFPLLMNPILNFGGKSIGEYLALFLLGFFVLSKEEAELKLEKYRYQLAALALFFLALLYFIFYSSQGSDLVYGLFSFPTKWFCCLALLGLGKHFLNFSNAMTVYLTGASFPVYIFHQSWLVAVAYCAFQLTDNTFLQVVLILSISILLTFLNYELFRRIRLTRLLFGIKK